MKNSPLATKDGWNENSMKGLDTIGKQQGRFPANFIHDGSDEVKDLFPYSNQIGYRKNKCTMKNLHSKQNVYGKYRDVYTVGERGFNDKGNASRFFYCAKASKQDRNEGLEDFKEKIGGGMNGTEKQTLLTGSGNMRNNRMKNHHPTVKPTDLMRYLVRLVTPKNEIVLDCFMGSGSTGKACALEGLSFVGIDLDKDYYKIAKARIDKALEDKRIEDSQTKLF